MERLTRANASPIPLNLDTTVKTPLARGSPVIVRRNIRIILTATVITAPLLLGIERSNGAEPTATKVSPAPPTGRATEDQWRALFDDRSLKGWKITNFGGEGEVSVEDKRLILEFGSPLTGVTHTREFPTSDYEIRLEAQRVDGTDFFCSLTFPVGKSHCSFIIGGWGGGVIGLSNIDGRDASENTTTDYMAFTAKKWYSIRLNVTDDRIKAWINDKQAIDQEISGHRFDTRPEVELSKPLGLASFDTRAAFRNIQFRRLPKTGKPKSSTTDR